jgi:hypothetical protein
VQVAVGGISGSVAPTSATISISSSATFAVVVQSSGSFSGPVNFDCGGLASDLNCTFDPAQVNLLANSSANSTLTVQVGAKPSISEMRPLPHDPQGPSTRWGLIWLMTIGLALLAVVLFVSSLGKMGRRAFSLPGFAAFALAMVLAISLISCGRTTSTGVSDGTGGASGTGASGGTGGIGGTSGSGGGGMSGAGTGGGGALTTQFTVQAQSGGAAADLGSIAITVP